MADQAVPTSDPSKAQAVQIPLQDFTVPTFPPEALSADIKTLTLTSDINLSEYHKFLSAPLAPIPELPSSIEGLNLELFTLGYPPGFLTQLAARLPNVKALTVFGHLIGGVEDAQKSDAESFFETIGPRLRSLHLIDAFGTKGFLEKVGGFLKAPSTKESSGSTKEDNTSKPGGLNLLEVSYTYRHSDEEFLTRIHASDLISLLQPSLMAASFNISPPPPQPVGSDGKIDEEDPENLDPEGKLLAKRPEGVMVLHPTHTPNLLDAVVKDWSGEVEGLKMLALTLFTLDTEQLSTVLEKHKGLRVLNVTLSVDVVDGWKARLWDVLKKSEALEVVEVVVSPGLQFYLSATNTKSLLATLAKIFPSAADMETLSEKCKNLRSFEMSILRTTSFGKAEWDRSGPGAEWTGKISQPVIEVPSQPGGEVPKELKEHYEGKQDEVKVDSKQEDDKVVATAATATAAPP